MKKPKTTLAERLLSSAQYCDCGICQPDGSIDAEVIQRGSDEYIFLNGRLLTYFGAPVCRNENAAFYLHEVIGHQIDDGFTASDLDAHYKNHLWPMRRGVFSPDDTIDLYRAMKRERVFG